MNDELLAGYGRYLETLTRERLDQLERFVTADVFFKDPFNACTGVDAMRHVLNHMYDSLEDVRFAVSTQAVQGDEGFLAWRYTCGWRGRTIAFDGVTHARFREGLVCRHVDHWDAASEFYEMLPVIGWPLKALRRKIAAI